MAEPLVTRDQIRAVLIQDDDTLDEVLDDYIRQTHSRIEIELGFGFPRETQVRTLDATDDSVLILPGPGASSIASVVENGTLLTADDYELDTDTGRTLLRLDSENRPKDWIAGHRIVVVTFVPRRAPDALVAAERVEVVRAFRGAQSGFADRIGVDGESSIPYSHAFSPDTRRLLEALKKGDGVGVW